MDEKILNRIVADSISQNNGYAYKIPDPHKSVVYSSSSNPFDGFGILYDGTPLYWESKLLKSYQAFNFNLIAEHQLKNLTHIYNLIANNNSLCIFIIGIWEAHKYFDVFFFSPSYINNQIIKEKKSVLKKELLQYKEENKYLEIQGQRFDVIKIKEKIIYE